ncbi:hypothetical protein [Micromonospora sp. RP3T]|uniref:hypothetical protein n=1 Tax=Micromonospora sp. RP3T TaxID=2135446 RepID=UPI0011B29158|nr:hypothetical protein [Micromonospora sp. RP3T]
MIATAVAADKEYRRLVKERVRLYDERLRLESRRFPGRGEEKIRADWKVEHALKPKTDPTRSNTPGLSRA